MDDWRGRHRQGMASPVVRTPTYTYERILALAPDLDANGWRKVEIVLGKDETACNPASTKHLIYGPAKVTYDIHPSGINTTVEDPV